MAYAGLRVNNRRPHITHVRTSYNNGYQFIGYYTKYTVCQPASLHGKTLKEADTILTIDDKCHKLKSDIQAIVCVRVV